VLETRYSAELLVPLSAAISGWVPSRLGCPVGEIAPRARVRRGEHENQPAKSQASRRARSFGYGAEMGVPRTRPAIHRTRRVVRAQVMAAAVQRIGSGLRVARQQKKKVKRKKNILLK